MKPISGIKEYLRSLKLPTGKHWKMKPLGFKLKGSIGIRIGIGFLIMILLLLFLGLTAYFSLQNAEKNLENINAANRRLILAMQIQNDFTEGSAGATKFIAYGDEKYLKQVERVLSDAVVLEHEFVDLVQEEKRKDAQQLIQMTAKFTDIADNDLPPLVRAYHRELAAGNSRQAQVIKTDVTRIADKLGPINEEASSLLQATVQASRDTVEYNIEASRKGVGQALQRAVVVCLAAIVAAVFISLFLTRMISKPLNVMLGGAGKLAEGDLRVPIEIRTKDEFGDLASAFNRMREAFRNIVSNIQASAQQVTASSQELSAISERSAQAADQVAASASTVSGEAAKQTASVKAALATVEQMSAGITQVAVNADEVAGISKQAAGAAEKGGNALLSVTTQMKNIETVVDRTSGVVTRLGEQSQKIGQIVDTITGIAGQTNLLALNAAIEAARAGDQGKGFAVVAEEVRKLAQQSHEAALEIARLIREIQAVTIEAVETMQQGTQEVKVGSQVVAGAGEVFEQIHRLVSDVTGKIQEISVAIHSVSGGSRLIVDAVKEVDEVSLDITRQMLIVSGAAQQEAASMEELTSTSQSLSEMAAKLQEELTHFSV